jgi:hypothetical protein
MVDISKLQQLAAEKGEDQTQAQEGGGGSLELPAPGVGGCRLISYIELGKHVTQFGKDKPKEVEQVLLEFELVGKKWPAKNEDTGRERPFIVRPPAMTKSLNEKATFYKLFNRLNYDGGAKHFAQLVGKDYRVTVALKEVGEGSDKRTFVNIRDDSGFTLVPPFSDVEDPESGEIVRKRMKVAEATTPLKIFLWDFADKEQWDSLFIDGVYGEEKDKEGNVIEGTGKSKNWIQEKIKSAINFKGSPISDVLGGGDALDIGDAEQPKAKAAPQVEEETDPLAEDE